MRLLTLLTEFSVNWDIQVSIVLTCMPWPAHLYSAVSLVFLYNILAVFITVFQCISFYLGLSSLSWIHCMIYRTCIIYRSQCTYTCSSISRNCFHSWYPTVKEGLHSGHLWYQNSIKAVVCWKVSVKSTMFRTVSTDRQAEVVVCVCSIFFFLGLCFKHMTSELPSHPHFLWFCHQIWFCVHHPQHWNFPFLRSVLKKIIILKRTDKICEWTCLSSHMWFYTRRAIFQSYLNFKRDWIYHFLWTPRN